MSRGKTIAAFAATAVVILVVAGTLWVDSILQQLLTVPADSIPAGWTDTLRTWARAPDLTRLSVEPSDSGDASALAWDSTLAEWVGPDSLAVTSWRLLTDGAMTPVDSTVLAAVAADTGLDRYARAARKSEWNATARFIATVDTASLFPFYLVDLPHYNRIRQPMRGLVVRAIARIQRRDLAGARADLAAATAIGRAMMVHEPGAIGSAVGRAILASAASGWRQFGLATGDTALTARAEAVRGWSRARTGPMPAILPAVPDSAEAIARDTTLLLAWRLEALHAVYAASMFHVRAIVFGPPTRVRERIASFTTDPDRDFAAVAQVLLRTIDTVKGAGVIGRFRQLR